MRGIRGGGDESREAASAASAARDIDDDSAVPGLSEAPVAGLSDAAVPGREGHSGSPFLLGGLRGNRVTGASTSGL